MESNESMDLNSDDVSYRSQMIVTESEMFRIIDKIDDKEFLRKPENKASRPHWQVLEERMKNIFSSAILIPPVNDLIRYLTKWRKHFLSIKQE